MSDHRADRGDEIPLGELLRQRSILVILVASCKTALSVFEADNAIDTELRADLSRLSERSEAALAKLSRKIDQST
jgi:hypothetical protein